MAVHRIEFCLMGALFIILFTNPCVGRFSCHPEESQALLSFKATLNVSDGILNSWVNGTDCCSKWDGVSCNNLSFLVERVNFTAYTNHAEKGVQSGDIFDSLCNLPNLKYLNLRSIGLTGIFPSCLGKLSHLQYLQLRNNSLRGIVPPTICQLTNITFLDISINKLTGALPPCLQNFSLLRVLDISFNQFHERIHLAALSSLKQLYARQFSFHEQITSSQLAIPNSVRILWLSHITISDTLLNNFLELKCMFLSYCVLNISTAWIPQFQLESLTVSSCMLDSQIPQWLVTQYSLKRLGLPDNNITGEIPSWLWKNNAELYRLNLSGNHLHGSLTIPKRSIPIMTDLDVSRNALTGNLPSLWPQYLQLLIANDNDLIGNIPVGLCNLIHLIKLDLANNSLNGNIPPCFANYRLIQVLNLGDNSLEGGIPHWLCPSSLSVRNNKLRGAFPPLLTNCKSLKLLDLGHNKFTGDIPWSVGNQSLLQVLIMKGNHFSGGIPSEIFQLKQLQILDLSSNNISGFIPENIASLHAMSVARDDGHMLFALLNPYLAHERDTGVRLCSEPGPFEKWVFEVPSHDELNMTVKGLERHYPYILSTLTRIDLSNNQLNGHVPLDIGKLKGLRFLNLSMNNLSGIIPPSLGALSQLESLDISTNRFSGRIPAQFQSLTSLACLNLSNNNLSGSIPQGGQMITFENTSYSGNPYLEGCPLPKKCSWPEFALRHHSPNDIQDANEDYRNEISWYGIGLGLSHVAGFSCVILLLVARNGWRKKYFVWVDKILKQLFPSIRNKTI